MLFKRGSTISAAEGGCQAEVGGTLSFVVSCKSLLKDSSSGLLDGQCWLCGMHGWYVIISAFRIILVRILAHSYTRDRFTGILNLSI